MTIQLPLPLVWPDQATFDNFYAEENAAVCAFLQQWTQNPLHKVVYLQGTSGVGISHLLYASCHQLQQEGNTAAYFSFKNRQVFPEMLEGMEQLSLLCCDDIEQQAGQRQWEEALFHCYNRVQASRTRLLLAGHVSLASMPWRLADLKSRLMASTVFTVQPLSDAQKIKALQYRAKQRGLILSDEVGEYVLKHCPRDMHALFALLEKLDHFSLSTQRRLTVPFVRQVVLEGD